MRNQIPFLNAGIPLVVVFALLFMVYCTKKTSPTNQSSTAFDVTKTYTLQESGRIDDQIVLPKGTKWKYVSGKGNQVEFILPDGYEFLIRDTKSNAYIIARNGGGYSCKCSGASGSCKVFYYDNAFGCNQSDCNGSCIGTPNNKEMMQQIVGVVNTKNEHLDFSNSYKEASLSDEGKQALLELPDIEGEIKDYAEILYSNSDIDFDKINPNKLPSGTKMIKAQIYGFSIAFVVNDKVRRNIMKNVQGYFKKYPMAAIAFMDDKFSKNFANFTELVQQSNDGNSSTITCSCSGGTRGGSCNLEKKWGGLAYYCGGCQTCSMTIS